MPVTPKKLVDQHSRWKAGYDLVRKDIMSDAYRKQTSNTVKNKKILQNTLTLYARQLFITFVNLYTLRVVLNTLGIEDYGIYTVIGGIVALTSFLPGTMSSATQRFFSFAIGQNDHEALKKIFSVNLIIYIGIAVLSVAILESAGFWFVHESLRLPAERLDAAQTLYQLSIFTFIFSLLASPFVAIIIAHEDMALYAYVSLFETVAKLLIAITLGYSPWDKLTFYGLLLLLASVVTTIIYITVCKAKYAECQFGTLHFDRKLLKEILGFTGWTLFGQLSTVARNQAVTILLNQAFNPAVAAARAIALTVAGQVNVFASNFNTSLYPPIIKHYSSNQKEEMFSLLFWGSKLSFFLMWTFALPLYLEMETVLTLWLGTVPSEAIMFTKLALIETLIVSFAMPLATAARAPGKMRFYELTLGTMQLLIFVGAWLCLDLGYAASSVFIIAIIVNLLMFVVRLLIVHHLIGLHLLAFSKKVLIPIGLVVAVSAIPCLVMRAQLPPSLMNSAMVIVVSISLSTVSMYYIGLDALTRQKVKHAIQARMART